MGTRARAVDETPAAPPRIRAHCGRATPFGVSPGARPPAGLAGEAGLPRPPRRGVRAGRAPRPRAGRRRVRRRRRDDLRPSCSSDRLRASLRPGSLLAHLGGEELGLLVPEADGMDGYAAAERLRRAVNPPGAAYTELSAGVCDIEQALRPDDLLRLARAALQQALADGGQRIWRYSAPGRAEGAASRARCRTQSLAGIRALARRDRPQGSVDDRPLRRRRRDGRRAGGRARLVAGGDRAARARRARPRRRQDGRARRDAAEAGSC